MLKLISNWIKYNGLLFVLEMGRSIFNDKLWPEKRRFVTRKRYGTKRKITGEETNNFYREKILSGKPFFAGRLGAAEMRRINRYIMIKLGLAKGYKEVHLRSPLLQNSPELADWYAEQIIELMPNIDIMPAWCSICEPYLIRKYAQKTKLCHFEELEPFFYEKPWTSALKGKKVLVINPFVDSIKMQYEKREKLFENPEILPEFELHTVKSVMVLVPEDNTYGTIIDAIDYMYEEAMKVDFDIALIGCGALGMVLAERFRQNGKQAVYLGGVLQMLFGIKGKRWDVQEKYNKMYNEHWIYPIEEPPKGADRLDGSCYWK